MAVIMRTARFFLPEEVFTALYPDEWLKQAYAQAGRAAINTAQDTMIGELEKARKLAEWRDLEQEYARRGYRPLTPRELLSQSIRAHLGEPMLFGDEPEFYATDLGKVVKEVEKMKVGW